MTCLCERCLVHQIPWQVILLSSSRKSSCNLKRTVISRAEVDLRAWVAILYLLGRPVLYKWKNATLRDFSEGKIRLLSFFHADLVEELQKSCGLAQSCMARFLSLSMELTFLLAVVLQCSSLLPKTVLGYRAQHFSISWHHILREYCLVSLHKIWVESSGLLIQ